ncbi:TPA: phage DNA ejection protein [Escherichia coli]|uniref:phage DNA ejection protein n=1 Tax=Escherichia coli TaxID=562 RepID=UPI002290DC14|nr:phage DNA ejection protein [Escherichia coli]
MATWQGSNGGLLAGIGGVNSNAPSVNDIGNTLQLIRQNNDIERSGANNVGLTALQGLSGIAGVFQQEKQTQRQKEFQQAYANAYASGDRGALRQLATQYLGNDTLRKYQQANAVYADEAAKLKNTRLKNVLMKGDLTPEVVNNMLFSKNKSEIKTLYNSVGRVGRAQMRNGIIGKAMEKSGGSPDQFLRQLNILQNQTGITFKGQEAAYLKGLKNYLQSTQQAAKAAVTTPTGQQTIPFIIGYGTAMNPATTGAAVSYGLLTRAYESEPFRNAMLRMANTPRGSTAFEKAMQQAQKAINALTQGAKSDALSE